jgi:hypothetical protein
MGLELLRKKGEKNLKTNYPLFFNMIDKVFKNRFLHPFLAIPSTSFLLTCATL